MKLFTMDQVERRKTEEFVYKTALQVSCHILLIAVSEVFSPHCLAAFLHWPLKYGF